MRFKPWLYFLVERDGRSRTIKNGIVTSTSKPTPINSPAGWMDYLLAWERVNHGSIKTFSLPMEFYLDAARILRNDIYKPGMNIDRELHLLIKEFVTEVTPMPGGTFKQYYKQFYKGQLDFSTADDKPDRGSVEMSIMSGGIERLLKAQEATELSIPFDDDAIVVKLDGIALEQSAQISFIDGVEIRKSTMGLNVIAPMSVTGTEGSASGLTFFDSNLQDLGGMPFNDIIALPNYFAAAKNNNTGPVVANIKGVVKMRWSQNDPNFGYRLRVLRSGMDISEQNDHKLFDDFIPVPGIDYLKDVDIDVPLEPGETLLMESFLVTLTPASVDNAFEFLPGSDLRVSYRNKFKETTVRVFHPWVLFKKIIKKITGDDNNAYSDVLQQCTYCVTCGDAIRGLENAELKISLKKFLQSFDAYLMGGWGLIDGKLRFENREYFYSTSEPTYPLGTVTLKSSKRAVDLMYPSIKIGHDEQEVDDVNGKYDFNGYHVYKTPIASGMGGRELVIQSAMRAGPFEIEIKRINFEGRDTTDDSTDNKLYVLDVDIASGPVDGVYSLDRSVVPDSGVPDVDTIFNVRLRPSEMFKRHWRWIRSWAYGYDNEYIVFDHANRNADLVVDGNRDGRSIRINTMGALMFKPWYFVFNPLSSNDISNELDNNILMSFDFDHNLSNYQGFMIRCAIAPNTQKSQEFKTLAWPNIDETKLI
jgi:hypothetical protein